METTFNVLIVDDEENNIDSLGSGFDWSAHGISAVYGAPDASEAREIIAGTHVDIMICDIEMPGESGLELIEWMREQKNLNAVETEYIILTCYPEYNYMRKAIQLGCSDYLIKPVDYDDLAGVIDKTIRTIRNNRLCQPAVPAPENEPGASGNLIIDKLIPYLKEHLCEHLTITDMARYLSLNPQYMMRLFKKTAGMSILEYVTAEKMKTARELLRTTDWSNELISDHLGYGSPGYLIKLFKNQYHMTPREYRKSIAQNIQRQDHIQER